MMYTREVEYTSYDKTLRTKDPYPVQTRDHQTYLQVLDYLQERSSEFIISDERFPESSRQLPTIKDRLSPWLLFHQQVYNDNCISHQSSTEQQLIFYDEHHYHCCKESLDILREYQNFFTIDQLVDFRFLADDNCILTTIGHENLFTIDSIFFHDLPELRKADETFGETVCSEYEKAVDSALPYLVPPLSPEDYLHQLDLLKKYSDTLSLIIPEEPSPAVQMLMQNLSPYLHACRKIHNWPGRWHIDTAADEYVYYVSEETTTVLKKLQNFFELECDLSFNRDGFSVFYVLYPERQCIMDVWFFRIASHILPDYNPERLAYRRYTEDYHLALREGYLYSLTNQSRNIFHAYLEKLFNRCDIFYLVTNRDVATSPLAEQLEPYMFQIPPPICYPAKKRSFGLRFTAYHCCPDSFTILKDRNSFFDLGKTISIIFQRQGKCVLYTIAEERLCIIDLWTLGIPQPGIRMGTKVRIDKSHITEATVYRIMGAAGCASRGDWEQYLHENNHSWEPNVSDNE